MNIGDKNISLQPCFFLISISLKLWADPIILKFLGYENDEAKLIFLLKEGIYTPLNLSFNSSFILFEINTCLFEYLQNFLKVKISSRFTFLW